MSELSFMDKMNLEAMERLELLKATPLSRAKILNGWQLTKCVVDFENEVIDDEAAITEEEMKYIREFEKKYGGAVYYVIQDQGMWPDGATFPRYTFLYVSQYEEEWETDREECIKRCKTIPAYVMNMEEPGYSEIAEIEFEVVKGRIINKS